MKKVSLSEAEVKQILSDIARAEERIADCDKAITDEKDEIEDRTEKFNKLENDGSADYQDEVKVFNKFLGKANARIDHLAENRTAAIAKIAELKARIENDNSKHHTEDNAENADWAKVNLIYIEAQIERQKESIEFYAQKMIEYLHKVIEGKHLIEYMHKVAEGEVLINEAHIEIRKLQKKREELETAISNQKLIDATSEICTAAAIDASVTAMENLLTVYEPVTFDLQHHTEDNAENAVIADGVATIDTAVTNTVIPPIDEEKAAREFDAESKKLYDKRAPLKAEVEELIAKLLEKKIKLAKMESNIHCRFDEVIKLVEKVLSKEGTKIKLIQSPDVAKVKYDPLKYELICNKFSFKFEIELDIDENGYIIRFNRDKVFAKYTNIKKLKAVMCELAAAIERGDEEFTFPSNTTEETVSEDAKRAAINKFKKLYDMANHKHRITLIDQEDDENRYKTRKNYELIVELGKKTMFEVSLYEGERKFEDNLGNTWLAEYNSVESFEMAMTELQKAFDNGDKEFQFPADC